MTPKLSVRASEYGVTEVSLCPRGKTADSRNRGSGALPKLWQKQAEKEIRAYFTGQAISCSAPCDLRALPAFTRAVLKATAKIPYGEVRSYAWVARALGQPKAARAVGNALARNPIPIIVPCHRIVKSDGSVGGFALGSAWKKRLLALEKRFVRCSVAPEPSASRRRSTPRRKF